MSRSKRWWSRLLLLIISLGLVGGLSESTPTAAQDGPQCPPGFHFERMSGVGCVQDNCPTITGARYSYTGTCICGDEYKGCYGPIIAPDYDSALCFPFCPVSQLLSCVSHDATCPELAPPVENPPAEQPAAGDEGSVLPAITAEVEALLRDLEEFLTGEGHPINAGRSAAAAAAASALLTAWVIANLVGGGRLDDLLEAVRRWLGGGRPASETSEPHKASLLGGKPVVQETGQRQVKDRQGAKPPPVQAPQKVSPPLSMNGTAGAEPEVSRAEAPAVAPSAPPTVIVPGLTPQSLTTAGSSAPTTSLEQVPATNEADPAKVNQLQERFRELVDIAIENGMYVANRNLVEKGWNGTVGGMINYLRDMYGGQCGEFAEWGRQWTQSFAEDIFGPGVIVDTIYIGESSSERAQALIYDPIDWLDSWYAANHAATRVILPTGESYVLDYWQSVGDRQRGLYEKSSEAAYNMLFGGKPNYPQARLVPEKEWLQQWQPRFDSPGDRAAVHNLHYAQSELQKYLNSSSSEDEAFARFRADPRRGVPDDKIETVINSYKKGGVWWGSH